MYGNIVLGLGNPGPRYAATRHNLGFRVTDLLARRRGLVFDSDSTASPVLASAATRFGETPVLLAKPLTYMNRSGMAGAALCERFGVSPEALIVVYDDADLEFGRIRIRGRGKPGGHRGVVSLVEVLGTDVFPRVKLGIRGGHRETVELVEYVLEEFDEVERPRVERLVEAGADAVETIVLDGLEAAMGSFNARKVAEGESGATPETLG